MPQSRPFLPRDGHPLAGDRRTRRRAPYASPTATPPTASHGSAPTPPRRDAAHPSFKYAQRARPGQAVPRSRWRRPHRPPRRGHRSRNPDPADDNRVARSRASLSRRRLQRRQAPCFATFFQPTACKEKDAGFASCCTPLLRRFAGTGRHKGVPYDAARQGSLFTRRGDPCDRRFFSAPQGRSRQRPGVFAVFREHRAVSPARSRGRVARIDTQGDVVPTLPKRGPSTFSTITAAERGALVPPA